MSVVEDIRAIRGVLERIENALCGQRVTRFGPVEVPTVETVPSLRLVEGVAADVDSPIDLVPVEDAPTEDEQVEPQRFGLYSDRQGDTWSKTATGWHLIRCGGVRYPEDPEGEPWLKVETWGPLKYIGGERNELEPSAAPYKLEQVVSILHSEGIDTGLRRLKQYLNTGICWTDGFNNPRECAADFLVVVKKSSPGRDAVVRVTVAGVAKLVEQLGAKK
ncbi:hypothetical protein 7S3_37 [uncultured Caudovirales phage]|uniref:Uncharacterized protein n=1 Tax=uncultured Caudovirales phage TaxID=2100421 RepID=A0A2H4J2A4_9CAUD|nr:hypothetical protein 7S3_37 [uncultured Caudovirales phage]